MNELLAILKKLEKRTLIYLGSGLFLLVYALGEFLPNFNDPIGMLLISIALLYAGIRAARSNFAEASQ